MVGAAGEAAVLHVAEAQRQRAPPPRTRSRTRARAGRRARARPAASRATSSARSRRLCAFSVLSSRIRCATSASGTTMATRRAGAEGPHRRQAVVAVGRPVVPVRRSAPRSSDRGSGPAGRSPSRAWRRGRRRGRAGRAWARPDRSAGRRRSASCRRADRGSVASTEPPSASIASASRVDRGRRRAGAQRVGGDAARARGALGPLLPAGASWRSWSRPWGAPGRADEVVRGRAGGRKDGKAEGRKGGGGVKA